MAMDQNQDRRRGHFHRGRRGQDRRGFERRTPPPQAQEHGRDQVDVEQIMREVRARIAQRHGIELSTQQIQELAARRLESILDPRSVKPALLDQVRQAASAPGRRGEHPPIEAPYTFNEGAIYESHRGLLRFFRRLFAPLLKLLFNPAPIERALTTQARLNVEAAQREAERERQQTEWNALHYEIVQRLVTEVSRVSIELQAMSGRIESLSAKVDFNERRVRGIEGAMHQARPAARSADIQVAATTPISEAGPGAEPVAEPGPIGEGAKRRRRRRRGRRGGAPGESSPMTTNAAPPAEQAIEHEPAAETPPEPPTGHEGPAVALEREPMQAASEPAPPASEIPPTPEAPPEAREIPQTPTEE